MRNTFTVLALTAVVLAGCAKSPTAGTNDSTKRYFEAWAQVAYPDAQKTALGSYVIECIDGTGAPIADSSYIKTDYTLRSLDGTVSATSIVSMAQQIGSYVSYYYYGPSIWYRGDNALYAGVDELLEGMHVGSYFKAAIPGWLITTNRYDTAEEYEENESGTDMIYEFTVTEAFDDIVKYEIDSLVRYMHRNHPSVDVADTVDNELNKYGFYYVRLKESDYPDSVFTAGTNVYLNYTGKLLNGQIFDTTIEKTAKDAGLYSSSSSYSPTYITWPDTEEEEDYTDITMGSDESTVIDGFAYALYHMKPHEKGLAIFYSAYGYSYSGSGSTIPAYSPLIFELELVDEP